MTKRETLRGLERKTSTRKPGLCMIMDDWEGVRCNWNTKLKKQTIVCVKTGQTPTHEECDKCENEAHWLIIHVADDEPPKTHDGTIVPRNSQESYDTQGGIPPDIPPVQETRPAKSDEPTETAGQASLPETKTDDEPQEMTLIDMVRNKRSLSWEI